MHMSHYDLTIYGLFIIISAFLVVPVLNWGTGEFSLSAGTQKGQADFYSDKLGTVRVSASCSDAANQHVVKGVALLHHMTYQGSRYSLGIRNRNSPL